MKHLAALAIVTLIAQMAWAANEPIILNHVPRNVYVPSGFDNNDNAQVVFEGEFVNSCYRAGVTNYYINENTQTITVENKVQFYEGQMCLMIILPYKKEINIGVMKAGEYKLNFVSESGPDRQLGSLNISESTTDNADDFLYAPVTSARYDRAAKTLSLVGNFSNSCLRMKNVLVRRPAGSGNNVIEVLPEVELLGSPLCEPELGEFEFSHPVSLEQMGEGRVLVHVRSLNGQAINLIENL